MKIFVPLKNVRKELDICEEQHEVVINLHSWPPQLLEGPKQSRHQMLHASLSDTTMMRERLSYSVFREMGVPAPRQAGRGRCCHFDAPHHSVYR